MREVADVIGDIGVLDPLTRPFSNGLQPSTSVGRMFTDLFAYSHGLLRSPGEGVKGDASGNTCQAAHDESLPDILHVISFLFQPCNPTIATVIARRLAHLFVH
jgi:hypothetical protein